MNTENTVKIRKKDFLRCHLTPRRITEVTFERLTSDMKGGGGFAVLTADGPGLLEDFWHRFLTGGRKGGSTYAFHRIHAEWMERDPATTQETRVRGEFLFLPNISQKSAWGLAEKLFGKPYLQAGILWGRLHGPLVSLTSQGAETLLTDGAGKDDILWNWAIMRFDPSREKGTPVAGSILIERRPVSSFDAIRIARDLSEAFDQTSPYERLSAVELAKQRERLEGLGKETTMPERLCLWWADFRDCEDASTLASEYIQKVTALTASNDLQGKTTLWAEPSHEPGEVYAGICAEVLSDAVLGEAIEVLVDTEFEIRLSHGWRWPFLQDDQPEEVNASAGTEEILWAIRDQIRLQQAPELSQLWLNVGWDSMKADLARTAGMAARIRRSVAAYTARKSVEERD